MAHFVGDQKNPLLDAALTYARLGYYVYPVSVRVGEDGKKRVQPHVSWGTESSVDETEILGWFGPGAPYQNTGIAIDCHRSGIAVVDLDGEAGITGWARLQQEHGAAPAPWQETRSGGRHHFFRQRPDTVIYNTASKVLPGIDVRGAWHESKKTGGTVFVAPTVMLNNPVQAYAWRTGLPPVDELPLVPEWLPPIAKKKSQNKEQRPHVAPRRPNAAPVDPRTGEILEGFQGTPEGLRRYIEKRAEEIRRMPVGAPATQPLNDIAFELAQFVPHQISMEAVRMALCTAVDTWEDGHEQGYAGIEQGLKDTGKEPRVWEEQRAPSVRRTAPRPSDQFEDSFLAETVARDVLIGAYRYVPGVGWKAWTGRVWRACDDLEVADEVRRWAVGQYGAALDQERSEPGSVPTDSIVGWRRALKANKQETVLRMAMGVSGVFTTPEELDPDPDLLNVQNGVVDLRTGELLPSDPGYLMTRIAGAEYRVGYTHPDWNKALEAVPESVRPWLQLRLGQATTGHTPPDDLLVVSQGSGENGKSTVNTATDIAMGSYYTLLSDRVLMADPSAHPTELMDLMGVRYAVMEETPEARRLDTQRLKRTVGTPKITARRMRENSVTFTATHSMFISTNFRPEITETDHGSWRRLALVTYPYIFRKPGQELLSRDDRQGDPGLRDRCKNDRDVHAAALTWMVEGARRWYAANRVMPPLPEQVEADTLEWRKESDMALGYISEHLIFDSGRHVRSSDLMEELNRWLADKRMNPWNAKTVATRLGGHDEFRRHGVVNKTVKASDTRSEPVREPAPFDTVKSVPSTYKAWVGVRFRTPADEVEEALKEGFQDPVTGVTGATVNARETPSREFIQASGNSGNSAGHGGSASAPQIPVVGRTPLMPCEACGEQMAVLTVGQTRHPSCPRETP